MSKIRVRVKNIDEPGQFSPLFYRSRTTHINFKDKEIETPCRAVSRSEFNAKKETPLALPFFDDQVKVLCNYYELASKDLDKFLNTNEKYRQIYTNANSIKNRAQYSGLLINVVQPCKNALSEITKQETCNKLLRMVFELQRSLDPMVITIPYLGNFETTEFLSPILDKIDEDLEIDAMPVLDLAHEPSSFRKIIDFIREKNQSGAVNLLGLIYHKYPSVASNYDYVWSRLRDQDIGIFLLNAERLDYDDHISTPHFCEFRLGDVCCVQNPRPFQPDKSKEKQTKIGVKFFYQPDLKLEPISDVMPDPDYISSDLELMSTKDREFVENLLTHELDDEKLRRLNYLSKTHEILSSNKEFTKSREFISDGDSKSYIKDKKTLSKKLSI